VWLLISWNMVILQMSGVPLLLSARDIILSLLGGLAQSIICLALTRHSAIVTVVEFGISCLF